jgi:predicted site-specific integrase-resolvase
MQTEEENRVIWRRDLQATMQVTGETMRRWLRSGKLPVPDVEMSRKTVGWRVATLRQAGIKIA